MKLEGFMIKKGVLIVMIGTLLSVILHFGYFNNRDILTTGDGKQMIQRNKPGEGSIPMSLQAKMGEERFDFSFTLANRKEDEVGQRQVLEDAVTDLERIVLDQNENYNEVRSNLNLVTSFYQPNISVGWQMENSNIINANGIINHELIPPEGVIQKISAILSYDETSITHEFFIHIFPPLQSEEQSQQSLLHSHIKTLEEESRLEEWFILPSEQNHQQLIWDFPRNNSSLGIFFLSLMAAFLYVINEKKKKEDLKKNRDQQLFLEYPRFITTFTLYIEAGMTVRNTWFKMSDDYLKNRDKKGLQPTYEEMIHTMYSIKSGKSEGSCYEEFGKQCEILPYRKFGTILSQNLRKGTKGVAGVLKNEANIAFDERKNLAKKLGEEAGTKLLVPMFMMLAVVLFIVIIPAFLSLKL